jgi:hypothetical protein
MNGLLGDFGAKNELRKASPYPPPPPVLIYLLENK